jgi:hypothetical protein
MLLAALFFSSTLIGYLAAKLLTPEYRPRWAGIIFKISLGAGLGAGLTSCLYFAVWRWIGPSAGIYVLCELALLVVVAAASWRSRSGTVRLDEGPKPALLQWLLLVALAGSVAMAMTQFVGMSTSNPYGSWDALAIWNLRAKFLAQGDGLWENAFSPLLVRTHPDYPLLTSGYIARCWRLTGSTGDVLAPVLTAALYWSATVGLVVSALRILRGWSAAMLGGLIVLGTIRFLQEGPSQYADVPLAFYFVAAFALILLLDAEPQRGGGVAALAGLALGFAAWTKNEGLLFAIFAGAGIIVWVLLTKRPAPARTLLLVTSGAALPLAIALYFKFFLAPATGTFANQSFTAAVGKLAQLSRYGQIIQSFWQDGLGLGRGLAHPVISLGVLAGFLGVHPERRRKPAMIVLAVTFLAVSAAYFLAYLVTPMDLAWHLSNSVGRLYVQLWPSLVFLSLVILRSVEETGIAIKPRHKSAQPHGKREKKARVG